MGLYTRTHVFFSAIRVKSLQTTASPWVASGFASTIGASSKRVMVPSKLGAMLRCSYGLALGTGDVGIWNVENIGWLQGGFKAALEGTIMEELELQVAIPMSEALLFIFLLLQQKKDFF